jgi:hypothetical protein
MCIDTSSPVNLRFYLKLIAKEFISTVISSWHKHIQRIKNLEISEKEKSKNFTKQNMQKYEEKKYPATGSRKQKKMIREIFN